MSLAILLLAVLAILAGIQFSRTGGGTDEGCSGVRQVYERVAFIEKSHDVPTTKVYADAVLALRRIAVTAPPAVGPDLRRLADAYGQIGGLLDGFDPQVASTYHVYEEHTVQIEAEQTVVDSALPAVGDWLTNRCG